MIGKLIKNDLKSGIRIMGNIYLAAAIAIGAMLFSALFNNGILKFLCSAAVIGITLVAVVVTFASVVFGTNKSLFGREGYLTQTLPVRTSSLIFSKWLSSSIWVILSYTLAAVAIVGVFVYWTMENQEGAEIYEMIYSFAQSFGIGAEKVYIVYRRSMDELPARKEEVEHAVEEGIEFLILTSPVEILGFENENDPRDPKNGFVTGIKCIKMELGEPDERGRRRPVAVENSDHIIDVDTVVMSIGTSPNPLIKSTTKGLEVNSRGCIVVEEATGETTKPFVYAGGDAVTGAATVISAMGAGKTAAKAIDEYLNK